MKTLRFLILGLMVNMSVCGAPEESKPDRSQVSFSANFLASGYTNTSDFAPLSIPDGAQQAAGQPASAIAEAITPEIQALADSMGGNPTNLFNFVHDKIRYVHYFGSKKGAALTLLERSGNDFDQCALLSALLQAAGYAPNYQFGLMAIPYDRTDHNDLHHWLGLSLINVNWTNTLSYFSAFLGGRGNRAIFDMGDNNSIAFQRVWLTLKIGSYTYYLDPSFKISEPITGINLASAMGLSTNTLLSAAGGTSTANYVTNLNESALRGALQDCNSNLLAYLSNNVPNATMQQVIGGQQIVSSAGQAFNLATLFPTTTDGGFYPILNWTSQPTNFMSTFSISVGGSNKFWYMPELQGQRVSLTFSNTGLAQLWLDDTQIFQTSNTGSSNTTKVVLSVTHPYGGWNTTNNVPSNVPIDTGIFDESSTDSYMRTNASYAIMYSFEASPQWLQARQQKLSAYQQQGLGSSSRQVTTETLNVMGLNWMVQTELTEELLAQEWGALAQNHHRLGRMGQEAGQGYYVDVYMQENGTFPTDSYNGSWAQPKNQIFDVGTYLWSALEHGVIEQMQNSNLVASSTIKMMEIAATNSQALYLASSANWTSGVNVRGSLVNYGNTLSTLDSLISGGFTLLLPQNGSNHVAGAGTWAGTGYVELLATATNRQMGTIIGGGYHGGYDSDPNATVNPTYVSQNSDAQPNTVNPAPASTPPDLAADPVNMADGTFQLSGSADLSLGQSEPRGISLSRYYSTALRNYNKAGMANGWLHRYCINLVPVTAAPSALATATPQQITPMIVAAYAALNLYTTSPDPKNWTVTALIAKWGVDQIINNAISVSMGKDTIQFVKQPDGSFTPPAGNTMTLTKSGSAFTLTERHGNAYKFSSNNLLTNIIDQYGQGMTFSYNSSNLVSNISDWKNRALTFNYSGSPSRLVSVTNTATGRAVIYNYATNANGQWDLTSVTDPEGKTSSYTYDANHQIIATFDALSHLVVSNKYGSFGRVTTQYTLGATNRIWQVFCSGSQTTVIDPAGGQQQYFYDDKARQVAFKDALGKTSQTVYDGGDHAIMTVSPLNETNRYIYDSGNNLVAAIDPLGFSNTFVYDAQNNLVASVDKRRNTNHFAYNGQFSMIASTNAANDFMNYSYNSDGTVASRTDAGGTTTYGYDSYGQVNSITYPSSLGSESFVNNALGDVTSHTDGRGFVTSFQFNLRRQLTNSVAPTNLVSKIAYDAVGNTVSTTDARGYTNSYVWSATRHLLSKIMPTVPQGTPVVTNIYDNCDWLIRQLDPLQKTNQFTNDLIGQVISKTDPVSRTSTFTYNANGRIITTVNAATEQAKQGWNARGELIAFTNATGGTVLRSYDGAGNQVALTNLNTRKWQFQYDAASRLTNTITPLGRSNLLSFNHQGLLATAKDPAGQTTTFSYDAKGRLTSRADNIATTTYQYDANDNLITNSEAGLTSLWTYDAYNRVSSYQDVNGNLMKYGYDANGNMTSLIYPGNKTVSYAYDSLNRLTNVTDWAGRQTTFVYDLDGRMTSLTRPNGTYRTMAYDGAGQITNILEQTALGFPIALFKLNWNAAAEIQWEFAAPSHTNSPIQRRMTYDNDDQLATVATNLLTPPSVTNDLNGNLTWGPATNMTFTAYTYDARNRLLNMGGITNAYDGMNNRIGQTYGTNSTAFVVNPNAKLPQVLMRIKGGVTNYYVYGAGLLYEETETSTTTNTLTYHSDYRGSTTALTDGSGNVTDRIEYSAFGITTFRVGTSDTPFLFNGRYGVLTDFNGLLYMRARYYNPYICRFINPDPSGFSAGLNFYVYANGDPISLIDPYGLWSWSQTFGVVRVVGGFAEAAAGATLGAATSWTGVGAIAGGAVALHGLDQLQAGMRQAWNGGQVDSATSSGLQVAGMSRNAANLTDAGISIVGSFGTSAATTAIRAQTVISAEAANANVLQQAVYYEIGQKTVSADANAFYSLWSNPIDRGAAMVADQGWMAAFSPQGSGFWLGIGKTFSTGPTPLGWAGVAAVGAGVNAAQK